MSKKKPDYRIEDGKIVVANTFIRAVHPEHMGLSAMKLFRLTIMQCKMNDKEFFEVEYKLHDIARLFHTQPQHIYRDVVTASKKMMQSLLTVTDSKGKVIKIYTIFRKWEYFEETATIKVRLNEDVAPLFLQLRKNFTRIPIAAVLSMRSKYGIRLFEAIHEKMLSVYPYASNAVEVSFTLEELRRITSTENQKTYDKISNIKDKILKPAIADIEEYGEWKIITKDLKQGRQITGFAFQIWSRNGYEYIEDCKAKGIIPEQIPGQMSIYDYLPG